MIEAEFSTLPAQFRPKIQETVYEAQRTETCPTGMRGRIAVMEVLEMTPRIEKIVLQEPVESRIWAEARKEGVHTMKEDAYLKAFEGKIPFSEAQALASLILDEDEPEKSGAVVDSKVIEPPQSMLEESGTITL
jgi:type II secretory ATPase GspE/PulE/Tfp pilus assembly ATPase PilB-like protein